MKPARIVALRLAKEGFGGGNPEAILGMRSSTVLDMLNYSNFTNDYHDAAAELNRPDNK